MERQAVDTTNGKSRARSGVSQTTESCTELGRTGEAAVFALLNRKGFKPSSIVAENKNGEGHDCIVNGKRVEIKTAWPRLKGEHVQWSFNIHRHNEMSEEKVDVYILRLEDVPGFKYAIHLFLPSPLGKPTISITLRSLLTRYGQHFNRYELLGNVPA